MKEIICDIETYSDVDLSKCGIYRYTQSPNFEILLFAYSIDFGAVQVVDLAAGEKIPEEIINALTDNKIKKYAYNASFERVCLSRFLGYPVGFYLSPDGWFCDMVHAAYLGLPLSLENVGIVLGLEKKKLSSGKELIRYFCIPQEPKKSNCFRTRNHFYDDKEKWDLFKTYNKRDVETEMEIHKRLDKFPVPDTEWDNYHLDQRINDYGIMLDMDFVEHAIKCDEENAESHYDRVKKITGIDNPNSPKQLKEWLLEQGIVGVDSLAKADVARLLKDATGNVEEILRLRQTLAKSSVKKYTAMQNAVCKDQRARGLIQFYGANRTGRFCLTGDHEVLTTEGWKRLDEWQGGKIACWCPSGEIISFQKAKALEFDYVGDVYEYEDKRISQISTPEHKMYVKKRYGGKWQIDTIENMKNYRPSIPFVGYQKCGVGMEQEKLRVLVMTQADGCYTEQGDLLFAFHKIRKYERCKKLLRNACIQFIAKELENTNATRLVIKVFSRQIPLWLRIFNNKTYGTWIFNESSDVFFDELQYWDGYKSAKNSIQYCTCNKVNADIVQAFAHITGRAACIREKIRSKKHQNWKDAYVVNIWLTPINCHEIKSKPKIYNYEGKVYCAETNTGFFLVRRNGQCWITGNSGRLVQVQNLPQNHLAALEEARELIRLEDLDTTVAKFGAVSSVLSELIRTAFIPKPGCRFIVADFSSIEARVIAWYAKEEWRLKLFDEGGDIYCQSASKMFGVPVVKNGVNGELRQKGKIAELACGYGGSVGALKAFGAVALGIKEEELQGIINAWRASSPRIVKFWWDIDRAVKYVINTRSSYKCYGLELSYERSILFIRLPSGRRLAYCKPRLGINGFGSECVTYEGLGASKKWERIESYGPKFVENIVQATARDILCEAMMRLHKDGYKITMHVHDEVVLEVENGVSTVEEVCRIMSITPSWAEGLNLRADGYECKFYKKE